MRTGLAPTLTGSSLFSFQGTGAVQRRIPSLSQATFEVKSFFSGPPGGGLPSESALGFFSGFARWKDRARASPGEGKIRKLPRDVKRESSRNRKKARRRSDGPVPPGGRRRVRATRRRGPWTVSGARRESVPVRRTEPNPPRVNRFPPPHLSVCLLAGRLSLSIERRNPTKVGFRLEERACRHASADRGSGKRRRRPSIDQPPARSAASVAG